MAPSLCDAACALFPSSPVTSCIVSALQEKVKHFPAADAIFLSAWHRLCPASFPEQAKDPSEGFWHFDATHVHTHPVTSRF